MNRMKAARHSINLIGNLRVISLYLYGVLQKLTLYKQQFFRHILWFFKRKIVNTAVRNWNVLFTSILVVFLINYLVFIYFMREGTQIKQPYRFWWAWPPRYLWSVGGKLPRYGDIEDPSLSITFKYPELSVKERYRYEIKNLSSDRKIPGFVEAKVKFIFVENSLLSDRRAPETGSVDCDERCIVSYNDRLRHLADAVLFSAYDLAPVKRSHKNQLYVLVDAGPPSVAAYKKHSLLKHFDDYFNLTMTYRRDSDIYFPFGTMSEVWETIRKNPKIADVEILLSEKVKEVAWVTGDCHMSKGYGFQLRMVGHLTALGVSVDIFGGCVSNQITDSTDLSKYKFILAFEEKLHCRDYISQGVSSEFSIML
ncbi:uncharacterized protein LOC100182826 [Ciona intestinalis]